MAYNKLPFTFTKEVFGTTNEQMDDEHAGGPHSAVQCSLPDVTLLVASTASTASLG